MIPSSLRPERGLFKRKSFCHFLGDPGSMSRKRGGICQVKRNQRYRSDPRPILVRAAGYGGKVGL